MKIQLTHFAYNQTPWYQLWLQTSHHLWVTCWKKTQRTVFSGKQKTYQKVKLLAKFLQWIACYFTFQFPPSLYP